MLKSLEVKMMNSHHRVVFANAAISTDGAGSLNVTAEDRAYLQRTDYCAQG